MGRTFKHYSQHSQEIREVASRYPVDNIRIFGSVPRGENCSTRDIYLLVDPVSGATLVDLGGLQQELQSLLKVRVDLMTPGDLPTGFRASIVSDARPV